MNKKFDWKIFSKKAGVNIGIVLLSGLVVVWQEDALYMGLIPLIKAVLNVLKHM